MPSDTVEFQRFISIRQLEQIVGLSKSSIWRRIGRGEFPAPAYRERARKDPTKWSITRWDLQQVLAWRESKLGENKKEQQQEAVAA